MVSESDELPPAIAAVVRLWLARIDSPGSRRAYRRDVADFVAFAQLQSLEGASLTDLVDWRDSLASADRAPAYVARKLAAVSSLASFAAKSGAIARNFAELARPPKLVSREHERVLTVDYVAMLVQAAATDRDRALLRLLYYSGARCEEVTTLRWRSLSVDDRGRGVVAIVGKGKRVRFVLIPVWLYAQLVRLRGSAGDDAPMFCGYRGRPIATRSIHALVARTAKRARIPGDVSPHWLRHSHVTQSLDAGAPIATVQRDAGHASGATTLRYAHARPRDGSALYLPVV